MTAPQKICPQCQTPAPLDAAFCRNCGRQYRTQFASGGGAVTPSASAPSPVPASSLPPFEAKPQAALSPRMMQILVLLGAMVVFFSVLALRNTTQHGNTQAPAPLDRRDLPQPPPFAPPQVSTSTGNDSNSETANRSAGQERQTGDPNTPPVGPDGRIHLQSGGSITREEWEKARRAIQ